MTRQEWIVVGLAFLFLLGAGLWAESRHTHSIEHARRNSCLHNLALLNSTIISTALANRWADGDPIQMDVVLQYFRNEKMPNCPSDGMYVIGRVGEKRSCTIHGEAPEDTRFSTPPKESGEE